MLFFSNTKLEPFQNQRISVTRFIINRTNISCELFISEISLFLYPALPDREKKNRMIVEEK